MCLAIVGLTFVPEVREGRGGEGGEDESPLVPSLGPPVRPQQTHGQYGT